LSFIFSLLLFNFLSLFPFYFFYITNVFFLKKKEKEEIKKQRLWEQVIFLSKTIICVGHSTISSIEKETSTNTK
ncbi:hypothetical protein BD770DRAFT_360850, partial [Pilaira anomala]